jgi:glycosyltransferase 2 family protein
VKLRLVIIATLGLALSAYLVLAVGWSAVVSAVIAAGVGGFSILAVYALALMAILGTAWYVLSAQQISKWRLFVWGRMVRDCASEVLPFSQLGGVVVGTRAAIVLGVPQPLALASTVADITSEVFAQIAYIALGAIIFSSLGVPGTFAVSVSRLVWISLSFLVFAGMLLIALQRYGNRILGQLLARIVPGAIGAAVTVGDALKLIYRSRIRFALSLAIHWIGWLASALGTWMAFRLIGARIDFAAAIALDAFACAVRSAAVVVPSALGVQEAIYAFLAPLFGVGAEFGLAVSLLKRARDMAIGVPVLLIWQATEGRQALAKKTAI